MEAESVAQAVGLHEAVHALDVLEVLAEHDHVGLRAERAVTRHQHVEVLRKAYEFTGMKSTAKSSRSRGKRITIELSERLRPMMTALALS